MHCADISAFSHDLHTSLLILQHLDVVPAQAAPIKILIIGIGPTLFHLIDEFLTYKALTACEERASEHRHIRSSCDATS